MSSRPSKSESTPRKSFREAFEGKLAKTVAIVGIGASATFLANCSPAANAEKGPEIPTGITAPVTSGAETTSPATAVETTTPAAANTTEVKTGANTAELQALAASVTPDKLRAMSIEERKEAFTINVKDLDPDNYINSYLERFAVLEEARVRSGMTHEDATTARVAAGYPKESADLESYFAYTEKQYLEPATTALLGSYNGDPTFHHALLQTYDITTALHGDKDSKGQPTYDISVELDPSTIKIEDPMLSPSDPFTVTVGFHYKETFDANQLRNDIGGDREPYDQVNTSTLVGVVADGNGNLRPGAVIPVGQ